MNFLRLHVPCPFCSHILTEGEIRKELSTVHTFNVGDNAHQKGRYFKKPNFSIFVIYSCNRTLECMSKGLAFDSDGFQPVAYGRAFLVEVFVENFKITSNYKYKECEEFKLLNFWQKRDKNFGTYTKHTVVEKFLTLRTGAFKILPSDDKVWINENYPDLYYEWTLDDL
jgi:hypothetical protein